MFQKSTLIRVISLGLTVLHTVDANSGISIALVGPDEITDISNLKVSVLITNTGTESLKLLNDPNSLLSLWETDGFYISKLNQGEVAAEGPALNFTGVKVKYSPTTAIGEGRPESFVTLNPGVPLNITHNLASMYHFAGSEAGPGTYTFKPKLRARTFHSVASDNTTGLITATETSRTTIHISGNLNSPPLVPSAPGASESTNELGSKARKKAKRVTFKKCTAQRKKILYDAATAADDLAESTYQYMVSNPDSTRRYTEPAQWFGTWDQLRFNSVQDHYRSIRHNPPTYEFDCSCTDPGIYAYVIIPDHFKQVYLCGAFWNAPLKGTDSQAGTIVHESTHFPQFGGTDDHAYGKSDCRSLASRDPESAVMNADSHEYFAENNPALS
ncbi:zincin [Ceratobasidium sp. AG-I]|nr:zincin [Ceratobasidium sp. AG-I]